MRTITLVTGIALGAAEFIGGCLWAIAGGGIYGSPLQGERAWVSSALLFLLVGPMTLLPASVLAIWYPRLAGVWLLLAGVASAFFAVLVMTPTPQTWVPGGDGLHYYTFKWSLALIVPFSLPMVILGLGFLSSRRLTNRCPPEAEPAPSSAC